MTKNVLFTLGRLPKGLDLARSFKRLGWRVHVAEPSRDHLARASNHVDRVHHVPAPATEPEAYLDALAQLIAREKIDLVVPVSEEIMFVSLLRLRDDVSCPVLSMPDTMIHRAHDKLNFTILARGLDLAVPETARGTTNAAKRIAETGPFIVKPRHSCAGHGVHVFDERETFEAGTHDLVQRRIIGQELSTCSLAKDGRVIATSIYKGTLMSGSVAVGFERIDHPRIDKWVRRFIEGTRWTGFVSFDFLEDEQGTPYAIECNPRTTSGLHFFNLDDIASAILGERETIRFRRETKLIQFWSCMEEFQKSFGDGARFQTVLAHLLRVRDVTWRWDDPLPLLTMPWTARGIIAAARRDKVPFGIAATRDLVWTEGALTAHDLGLEDEMIQMRAMSTPTMRGGRRGGVIDP